MTIHASLRKLGHVQACFRGVVLGLGLDNQQVLKVACMSSIPAQGGNVLQAQMLMRNDACRCRLNILQEIHGCCIAIESHPNRDG